MTRNRPWQRAIVVLVASAGAAFVPKAAHADVPDVRAPEGPSTAPAAPPSPAATPPSPTPPSSLAPPVSPDEAATPVAPEDSAERARSVEPKAAEPAPAQTTFAADPIADGGIIIAGTAFAGMLELINSTGEIRPQQIAPNFQRSQLLWIDRVAVSHTPDPTARTLSNVGLLTAVAYAVIDPILTGVRQKNVQSWLVDSVIYAESLAVTWGVTNLAKIAVRRPRPQAYIDADLHKGDPTYSNSNTDSALSFFSGHAALTAAVASTATYLAFARSPGTPRPWITLGVGTALTAFVSTERVLAGAHFPTDVIAGSIAGAGIGVLVAHLHRSEDVKKRRIWVGFAPSGNEGGVATVGGLF